MADSRSVKDSSRRRFLKYAGAGAVALAVVGVGGYEVYNTYFAPKPPLTIAWWGGPSLQGMQPTIDEFKRQTGRDVQVVVHQGGSANTIPKIAAAWPNVVIDLIGISVAGSVTLAQQGFSIPLSVNDIPALKDYPDNLYVKFKGQPMALIHATDSAIIVYRTDKITEPVTSFHDFMRPELKKRVAIGKAGMGGAYQLLAWALDYGGSENNIEPAFTALKQLGQAGNLAMIWEEEPFALNGITSGDIWAMEYSDYGTGGLVAHNAAQYPYLKMVKNPSAGKVVFQGDTLAIINGPRKDLAFKFSDIFLSPEMQSKYATLNGEPPANPMTPLDPVLAPWVNTGQDLKNWGYFADPNVIVQNMSAWSDRFDKEIRPLVST